MSKQKVLITGPYITNYSLAKVNRGLAVAMELLDSDYETRIWKKPFFSIDKLPDEKDLAKFPEVADLLTEDVEDTDIVIIGHYPHSPSEPYHLDKLPGKTKLMYLAWEETVFPKEKVEEINENLHGLMVISSFVKDIMRRNGVKIPIKVVSIAANDGEKLQPKKYGIETKKKFKFLHISTAKMRKGVDVLLNAYFSEFSGNDDVTLVIKSFPGPDNQVNELLGKLQKSHENAPEVIHINRPDLTEQEIADLTFTADCAVYPTRTEGFGLPIAEAMLYGTPVIATGYSGQMDFFSDDVGYTIDFDLVPAIDSEAVNLGAKWAEPDQLDLQKKMRHLFENISSEEVQAKVELARNRAKELTWENAAKETISFIERIQSIVDYKEKHLAVLTTYNTVCGVAEYSKDLYSHIESSFKEVTFIANSDVADRVRPDGDNVVRLWEYGEQDFYRTLEWLKSEKPDLFHIQLHSTGHFPLSGLRNLLKGIRKLESPPKVFITPHTVRSNAFDLLEVKDELQYAERLFIHNQEDLDYLKEGGIFNTYLFYHPFDEVTKRNKERLRQKLGLEGKNPIIATHGLISYHKGLPETMLAISNLKVKYPDILWLAVNAMNINNSTSSATYEELKDQMYELKLNENVLFIPDFLDPEQIFLLLQAADVGLLAYSDQGESASGAIRKYFAAGLPTVVTDIPMMNELKNEVVRITDNEPETIERIIEELVNDKERLKLLEKRGYEISSKFGWDSMTLELLEAYSQ